MSFYHVLPSNAAPNTFPNNKASKFSIPLDNPYNLEGRWEVALMNMSYTGCVNTFYNDMVHVRHDADFKARILKTRDPVRWNVPQKGTVDDMLNHFLSLKDIIDFKMEVDLCLWELKATHMFVILSPNLMKLMSLNQNVITAQDGDIRKWFRFTPTDPMPSDIYFTFIPAAYTCHTFDIKPANEKMSLPQLLNKFNNLIPFASMKEVNNTIEISVDNGIIILSPSLGDFISYNQRGIYKTKAAQVYTPNKRMSMEKSWVVQLYKWDKEEEHTDLMNDKISLPPVVFQRHVDAVAYLNKYIPYVKFSLKQRNYLQLNIDNKNVSITFTDALRDILGFDQNTYTGVGTFLASASLSLTRCIHYLYVYSNITEYVRIGNTEAPLLTVIPFSVSDSCDILKEQSYKNPMYIPLRHSTMSQIDVSIHDDAGDIVPFISGAVTSIRLHYRQV